MRLAKFLLAAASLAAIPAVAEAAVTVVGDSSARLCFEAAEGHSSSLSGLANCDAALRDDNLSPYEEVATHVNRGILRMRETRLEDAIADFDQAIALDPNQAEAYLNKGMALLQRDAGADAVPLFSAAIAKKTRRPAIAYYGRGVAHEMAGQIKQAYFDYKKASVLEPKWRDPRTELSRFSVRGN